MFGYVTPERERYAKRARYHILHRIFIMAWSQKETQRSTARHAAAPNNSFPFAKHANRTDFDRAGGLAPRGTSAGKMLSSFQSFASSLTSNAVNDPSSSTN